MLNDYKNLLNDVDASTHSKRYRHLSGAPRLPRPSGYEPGFNPGKGHWWTTGRASGPKMFTAPAKSQLTIGHRPSPMKTGSV